MKLIKKLIPLKDAEKIVFEHLSNYLAENSKIKKVGIIGALNRISAEDIKAPIDLPYFNRAAMDGYAVIAEDTFGASETNPIILNLVDRDEIFNGEAKKIFTGDELPKNANAVVMKEFCNEVDDFIEIYKGVHPNENVSRIGEDVKKGDVVLKKGEIINPYHLNMLASLGIKEIKVYNLSFGIISTGDELVSLEEIRDIEEDINKLKGKIINSNSYMLYGLVKNLGFDAKIYGVVEDNKKELKEAIKTALSENDVILITGGTSVSERDITVETVKEMGNVIVHGVNIRPGKPFGFGIINGKPIFMLSGYPVASAVQFELFIRSYFKKRKKIKLPLKRNIASELGRTDIVRVRIKDFEVEPLRITGSGVISSLTKADGYVIIPENVEGYEKGELVDVYLLK